MANEYRLHLLGGFRLENNGTPVKLARQKSKALLAYLALFSGAHTREVLATLFFPDALDADARKNLRVLFAELYKALGKEFFSDDRESVELNTEKIWVDAKEFTRDWRLETGDSISSLQSLISLYRGDLLPELYDDWVLQKRDELRERYVELLLHVVESSRAQSEYAQAIEWAQRVMQTDRANERAHQHLMFLYTAQGDRTAALNQFDACVAALDEELGVEPSAETIALAKKIKQQKTGTASEATRLTNLPKPLTSFVGRERELNEMRALLGRGEASRSVFVAERTMHSPQRGITLTGSGGSGKTRLALELGRALVDEFEYGVWFVDLAPLSDASLVPQQIAKALGVQEQANTPLTETLIEFLRERELLVILDNCEHLLDACAHLAQSLLAQSLHLSILATSREGLNLVGEQIYPLAPLNVPRTEKFSLAQLAQEFSAVRLFVERARLAQPHFVLDDANAPDVIHICQRLDGIPLAIELAAARVKQMSVRDIAARLDQRFDLLVGARTALPRQQTLRALIDWSYDLLNEQEKILFRRVSVFAGGWTIESAEEVCADDSLPSEKILDTLLRLVDKSLVIRTVGDESRYTMLEIIREYARERLEEANDARASSDNHLAFFLSMAEVAEPRIRSREQLIWLDWLNREMDNVRVALDWADVKSERGDSEQSGDALMRLTSSLWLFWFTHGYWSEAKRWYERALASGRLASDRARALALRSYGVLLMDMGAAPDAVRVLEESRAMWRAIGEPWQIAFCNFGIAWCLPFDGRLEEGIVVAQEGVALARTLGDPWLLAFVLQALASCLRFQNQNAVRPVLEEAFALLLENGDQFELAAVTHYLGVSELLSGNLIQARKTFEASLQYSRTVSDKMRLSIASGFLGYIEWVEKDLPKARLRLEESFFNAREIGVSAMLTYVLTILSGIVAEQGLPVRGAEILGAVAAIEKSDGVPSFVRPEMQMALERATSIMQAQLTPDAFVQALAMGRRLTLEQAFELGLQ